MFGNQSVLTASVPQEPVVLSAVCMNIDQRALGNGRVGHDNDRPTYIILHNPTNTLEVSCRMKNNPPSRIMVIDDIEKGSNSTNIR